MDTSNVLADLHNVKIGHGNLHRTFYGFCKNVHSLYTDSHFADDFLEGVKTDLGPILVRCDGAKAVSKETLPTCFTLSYINREYVFRFSSIGWEGRFVGRIQCISKEPPEAPIDQLIYDGTGQIHLGPGEGKRVIQDLDYIRDWILLCVHKDILGSSVPVDSKNDQ